MLGTLCGVIGEALDVLDKGGWKFFLNLCGLTGSVSGPQIDTLDVSWFVDNEGITERLAVSVARRLAGKSNRRLIGRKCFGNYLGGDRRILQTAAEWELLSEPSGDIDWVVCETVVESG